MYDIKVITEHYDCIYSTCSGVRATVIITDYGTYSEHDINIMLSLLEKLDDEEYKVVINDKTSKKLWGNVPWVGSKYYSCDGDDRYN
jgi:hypothetical protein